MSWHDFRGGLFLTALFFAPMVFAALAMPR